MERKKLLILIAALVMAACDRNPVDPSGAVASVSVAPGDTVLVVGQSGQMRATIRAADGTVQDGAAVTWHRTNPAVAAVSPAGMVRAVQEGAIQVRASGPHAAAEPRSVRAAVLSGPWRNAIFL